MKTNENSLRDLWGNIKRCITGGPRRGRQREKRPEEIFEKISIIPGNVPNMGKEIVTQGQETQRVPYRISPRRNTVRHILTKLTKTKYKEKILKASRGK